jgi:hypothetical protein
VCGRGGGAQSWWGAGVASSHGLLRMLRLIPWVQSPGQCRVCGSEYTSRVGVGGSTGLGVGRRGGQATCIEAEADTSGSESGHAGVG